MGAQQHGAKSKRRGGDELSKSYVKAVLYAETQTRRNDWYESERWRV
jgi:hypothetical protein